jgi:hypothetical protein
MRSYPRPSTIDAYFDEHPLQAPVTREIVLAILALLVRRDDHKNMAEWGPASLPLYSGILQAITRHYRLALEYLTKGGFIRCTDPSSFSDPKKDPAKGKCRRYQICEPYTLEHRTPSPKLIQLIRQGYGVQKRFKKDSEPLDAGDQRMEQTIQRLSIDLAACPLELQGLADDFNNSHKHLISHRSHHGRVYGSQSNCKKELRGYLQIDSEPTVELDVSNSHHSLIAAMHSPQAAKELNGMRDIMAVFTEHTVADMKLQTLKWLNRSYLYGAYPVLLRGCGLTALADAVERFHWSVRSISRKETGRILLRLEGMVYKTAVQIMQEQGIEVVTVHDSFIVKKKDQIQAIKIIQETMYRVIGWIPDLKCSEGLIPSSCYSTPPQSVIYLRRDRYDPYAAPRNAFESLRKLVNGGGYEMRKKRQRKTYLRAAEWQSERARLHREAKRRRWQEALEEMRAAEQAVRDTQVSRWFA